MLACHQAHDGRLLLDCGHDDLLLQPVEQEGHGGEVVANAKMTNILYVLVNHLVGNV